ncbi:MAG: hypothetical protein QG573_1087 [Acidobacteriota bacterium]|nr:hypothetical protein [Acidobacteriota bacterium]
MDEFRALLREFFAAGVRFLVVGGYATIAHGLTRATEDLDLWIEPTRENSHRARSAIERFGADVSSLSEDDLADPDSFFRIGAESGRRIDILCHAEGLEFQPSWTRRLETEFLGLQVPFLSLEDLIRNKEAVGRHRDLADVESLRAFHRLREDGE